jgi:hypothetical protein
MYFQTDYFYEQVISITRPAVNQASMTTKALGALNIIVPEMSDQQRYIAFVEQSDKSKLKLQNSLAGLSAIKIYI